MASDAIGMGITLNLRRIIFHSLRTFRPDTKALTPLDPSHVKQIAGAPSPPRLAIPRRPGRVAHALACRVSS